MPEVKIVYVDTGIANRFSDGTIEINKNLKNFPELKAQIIRHELKHTKKDRLNKEDFDHDLTITDQIDNKQLLKFMIKHPASLSQFLPLYYSTKRGWVMDINESIKWGIIISIIALGFIIF